MAYTLTQHFQYNAWANNTVASLLRSTPDEVFFRDTGSSFPSLAKTVMHIWGAQNVWLRRMQGVSMRESPAASFENDKQKLLDGLVESSQDFVAFIASFDPSKLDTSYSYTNLKGEPFEDTYEETMFHVVNHGTYHRGQIITMLRQAGIKSVVGTDLIHYLREQKKKK